MPTQHINITCCFCNRRVAFFNDHVPFQASSSFSNRPMLKSNTFPMAGPAVRTSKTRHGIWRIRFSHDEETSINLPGPMHCTCAFDTAWHTSIARMFLFQISTSDIFCFAQLVKQTDWANMEFEIN